MNPDLIWKFSRENVFINRKARADSKSFEKINESPIDSLRSLIAESSIDLPEGLPPMAAGLFGYMGYDAVRLSEKIPDNNSDDLGVPDGLFLRPSLICIFDRLEDIVTLVTPVWPRSGVSSEAAYEGATERLNAAVSDLQRSLPFRRERFVGSKQIDEPISNTSREEFHEMVNIAKDYIKRVLMV